MTMLIALRDLHGPKAGDRFRPSSPAEETLLLHLGYAKRAEDEADPSEAPRSRRRYRRRDLEPDDAA
jgi:hypothetical protein